ncbi:unnamed protein product, partial [marine sediment metagenome]
MAATIPVFLLILIVSCISCDTVGTSKENPHHDAGEGEDDDSSDPGDDDFDLFIKPPCAQPQDPPEGYFPYEASWLLVRFDDHDIPVLGLYAYFWLDFYLYNGCSYTAALSAFFMKSGPIDNTRSTGGIFTTLDIEYMPEDYNIFVRPYMRVRVDGVVPYIFHIDFFGEGYEGHLDLVWSHIRFWSTQWYSLYDATISDAAITMDGETFYPTGQATLERWHGIGGFDPADADFVNGYWIYEPFYWTDDEGERVNTIIY